MRFQGRLIRAERYVGKHSIIQGILIVSSPEGAPYDRAPSAEEFEMMSQYLNEGISGFTDAYGNTPEFNGDLKEFWDD